jgi:hypothetical protein
VIQANIHQGVDAGAPDQAARNPELVQCFRHEGRDCLRCDGSGYRPHICCAECGQPAGRPSQGGKALMGLSNRRRRDQPFYCLDCHPELGREPVVLEGIGS